MPCGGSFAAATEMAVVTLDHVGKRYGNGAPILADVSVALEPGGFYFLIGASGAGKTTLLNLVALAERPTSGRVRLFDRDTGPLDRAARAALRRRIGIVFQDFRLLDELSAADNVALPLRIAGIDEARIDKNVPDLLAWVGLEGRGAATAGTLSGGERQRVAIARAVIGRPQLLIADEPTGNVDDDVAMLLVRAFERINELGTTVLIATHDFAFARQFAHRRLHLEGGRLSAADGERAA
jgi:cell division transport system ATP-binding protein